MALFFINKYIYFISDRNQLLKRANYLGVVIWSWEGIIHPNGSTLYQARKVSCHVFVLGISIFASFYDFSIRFCNCSENEKWAVHVFVFDVSIFVIFYTFRIEFWKCFDSLAFSLFLNLLQWWIWELYKRGSINYQQYFNIVLFPRYSLYQIFISVLEAMFFFFKSWRPYLKS